MKVSKAQGSCSVRSTKSEEGWEVKVKISRVAVCVYSEAASFAETIYMEIHFI
jgi:hypothetical protein